MNGKEAVCKKKKPNKKSMIFSMAFWVLIWAAAALMVKSSLLLPGPVETVKALLELAVTGHFWLDCGWTAVRCIVGMALSFAAGFYLARASFRSSTLRELLRLPVNFFKSVPVMAIIIYVILLMTADWVAVVVCFLMCFPIVYLNILTGLDNMSEKYQEVAQIYGLSRRDTARFITTPGLLPQIKASVNLISGMSWKVVVASEVLAIPGYSLGYEMLNSKYYLNTADLFAYILVIVVLSLGFEALTRHFTKRLEWHAYDGSKLAGRLERKGSVKKTAGENSSVTGGITECASGTGDEKKHAAPGIILSGITKSFEGTPVLEDLDMDFRSGKVTALMGPSGLGKTTTARIIAGLETPDKGTVSYNYDMNGESPNPTISFLFQEDRLLPWLNVYDNIALALIGNHQSDPGQQGKKDMHAGSYEEKIIKMADALEIGDVIYKLPSELSGGMQHRTAIGRTYAAESDIMILDEPFRGLDEELRDRIISRTWDEAVSGKTVILITHDKELADKLET